MCDTPTTATQPNKRHAALSRLVPDQIHNPILTTTFPTHRLNKSRGQRIIWLLEELNLTYDVAVYKRDANKRAGPELKAIHPLGKSPTVSIRPEGADKDIVITESETIVEYICEHFGKQLIPKRYPEGKEGVLGAETEEWMRYKVCCFLPSLPILNLSFFLFLRNKSILDYLCCVSAEWAYLCIGRQRKESR